MANWNGLVMTDKGIALQSKVQAGEVLNITKLKLGSGTLPEETDIRKLTDLIKPEQNLGIGGREPNGDYCKISATISNIGLEAGYYVRELGVFAQDPDDGEILYAYTTDGAPDYLPAEGGSTVISQEFSVNIAVSDTEQINVEIDPGALATMGYVQLQIDEHNENAAAHEQAFNQHNADETAHYDMTGATGSKAGKRGFVPAPQAGDQNKALFGNGTYKQVVETINGIKPDENNNIDLKMQFYNSLTQLRLTKETTWQEIIDALPVSSVLIFHANPSSSSAIYTPNLELPTSGTIIVTRSVDANYATDIQLIPANKNVGSLKYNAIYDKYNAEFLGWKQYVVSVNGINASNGNVDLNMKFYNSLAQLGLEPSTVTFQDIANAMPFNSMLVFNVASTPGTYYTPNLDIPVKNGTLIIQKGTDNIYNIVFRLIPNNSNSTVPVEYIGSYKPSTQTWIGWNAVNTIIESYKNEMSYYFKYSNGWVEQGGTGNSSTSGRDVTLLVPMINTKYFANAFDNGIGEYQYVAQKISTTQIKILGGTDPAGYAWEVKGWYK